MRWPVAFAENNVLSGKIVVDNVQRIRHVVIINRETKKMNKTIKITIKSVYGNDMAYPACADAKTFADMLGAKTLTHAALRSIEKLGYTITVISQFGNVEGSLAA